jgi:amidase
VPENVTAAAHGVDAVGLAARIREGGTTAEEVVSEAIRRLEADPGLGAMVSTRFEAALAEARDLPDGPLRGVPIVVKDLHTRVEGLPSSGGSRLFSTGRAQRDSEVVARYRRAGMVVLGMTNSPELGLSASTEPALHGPTHNPWSRGRSPGGSSGGSAAVVAAGMVPVAHGSDGGGSIRIPASMCGLVGLKPGRGRVPTYPVPASLAAPTSVHHALTMSVRDSAALLDASWGPVRGDAFGSPTPAAPFAELLRRPVGPLRIGVTTTAPAGRPTDPACVAATDRVAQLCRDLGHTVLEVSWAHDTAAMMAASGTLTAAGLVNAVDARLAELGRDLAEDDLEPFTRVLLEHGRGLGAAAVVGALETAQRTGWQVGALFADVDVLLSPTLSQPVPPLGLLDTAVPASIYTHATTYSSFTSVFNMTGQPAVSVPSGLDPDGLPIGVQLAADLGGEGLLLGLAAQLEEAAPWPLVAPGRPTW